MKHTPTPWGIRYESFFQKGSDFTIGQADDLENYDFIATAWKSKEDAEYIVQCVNSHDELLEALKQTDATLVSVHNSGHFDLTVRIEQVRKAIQKAEGK